MKRKAERKSILILMAIIMLLFVVLSGCGNEKSEINSVFDLNDPKYTIGVSQGSSAQLNAEAELPNAKIRYFTDDVTAYEAVQQGKIDAYVYFRKNMESAIGHGLDGVRILNDDLNSMTEFGIGISPVTKIPDLKGEIDRFNASLVADGTFDDMYERWFIEGREDMPDIPKAENPDKHLTVGTTGIVFPATYYRGTELWGFDIEYAYRFAYHINADIDFKIYDFGSIVAAAKFGDVDCIMSNLNITPERLQEIEFSEPQFVEKTTAIVRSDETEEGDFFKGIAESFSKTFIREDRYKLFLQGLATTVTIVILSAVIGTVLGYILYLLYRKGNRAACRTEEFSAWLVHGMPAVVFMMILYYIIFGKTALSGTVVSVIGFVIIFSLEVFVMIRHAVNAVGRGQTDAAKALGFDDKQIFRKVILPQIIPFIMPGYKSAIIELIKATSIVGYIAVQDLTKMGDIVRSRTFEAFFPLIAVAAIYFFIADIMILIVSRIEPKFDHRQRKRKDILKEVRDDQNS